MHCTVQPGRYCMRVFSGGRLPWRGTPGGKMTATAEILLRSGFGVNRKGLQDIVVGLLCGKVASKMTGRKGRTGILRIREWRKKHGKCGIQFWRRKAGDAEFWGIEVKILANRDCCGGFYFADGVHNVRTDWKRGSANA